MGKSDGRTFRYFGPEAKVRTAQFLGLYTAWCTRFACTGTLCGVPGCTYTLRGVSTMPVPRSVPIHFVVYLLCLYQYTVWWTWLYLNTASCTEVCTCSPVHCVLHNLVRRLRFYLYLKTANTIQTTERQGLYSNVLHSELYVNHFIKYK